MKIGFDIDGVLASFNTGYIDALIAGTGRNTFLPGDDWNPPVWNFAELRGYTREEIGAVWEYIKKSPNFWRALPPHQGNRKAIADLMFFRPETDVYFITSRVGATAKKQTDEWLQEMFGVPTTALVVGFRQKGYVARALQLDAYIDDHYPNCTDVVRESPTTHTYVFDLAHNAKGTQEDGRNLWYMDETVEQRRVSSIEEMLRRENLPL